MNKTQEALKLALEYLEPLERQWGTDCKAHGVCTAIREALAEQPAQQEIEELTAQRDKLADILTRTANALKGQPAELSSHSWHDLPEVAQQIKAAQQQQEPVAVYVGETWGGSVVRLYEDLPLETPLYTSPQPSQQQEPVAYASDVEFDDETEIIPAEQKGKLGTAGLRIPLYIQPPASKPLTDEQVRQGGRKADPGGEDLCAWSFKQGVRFAEAAHGIKEQP